MRRVYGKELAPGHFIKTSSPDGSSGWGEVKRIQDGMAMVRSDCGTTAAWFNVGSIHHFYEKIDDNECVHVDYDKNVRIVGSRVAVRADDTQVVGARDLLLQAPTVQISSSKMDLVSNECSVHTGALEVRCGGGSFLRMDSESGLDLAAPRCILRGDLEVRGISFMDAIMRIDRDMSALQDRVRSLEASLAAASGEGETPGSPPAG